MNKKVVSLNPQFLAQDDRKVICNIHFLENCTG